MQILLLRHSIIPGNKEQRYIGRTDQRLTEEGAALAAGIKDAPLLKGVERLYTSPLTRCRQTAELAFPKLPQIVVDDLREMDFGDFEARTHDEMLSDPVYTAWLKTNCEGPVPNGETRGDFADRCADAFCRIVDALFRDGVSYAAIVCHGGTIMSLMHRYVLPEKKYYEWMTGNCCGYLLGCDAQLWRQKRMHLEESFQPVLPPELPAI